MLSAAFRFLLPISSHPVLHGLLRSFPIERPIPSSRVPPWDLSLVLSQLRGPPFEPLSSCSLRDLTRKVLFLVSLVTARWVGELQAVAAEVSFSRGDAYLSCVLEFRAKSESESRPLPRSFRVRSLTDFVGSLPDELLLCPVRALWVFIDRTSTLSPHPRMHFVSPWCPSCSLSKNALSFFLRSVILQSLSSASSSSLPRLPPLQVLLLLLLLCLLLHSALIVSGLWLPRLLLPIMCLCLLFWKLPHGGLPLFFTSFYLLVMFSSSLPRGFLWAQWWLRVRLFSVGFRCFLYFLFYVFFCFGWFQVEVPLSGALLACAMHHGSVVLLLIRPLWAVVSMVM